MIHLTRINHADLIVNADLIEHIEVTPDTVVSLTSGQKFMVLESADEVVRRVVEYRRSIAQCRYKSAVEERVQPGLTNEAA